MPPRDALISTGLILGITFTIAGLLIAAAHHILNLVVGIIVFIGFIAFCILIY